MNTETSEPQTEKHWRIEALFVGDAQPSIEYEGTDYSEAGKHIGVLCLSLLPVKIAVYCDGLRYRFIEL